MKFQDDISNMNTHTHTYIRTSRNQYVPHFFKVGGINIWTSVWYIPIFEMTAQSKVTDEALLVEIAV